MLPLTNQNEAFPGVKSQVFMQFHFILIHVSITHQKTLLIQ